MRRRIALLIGAAAMAAMIVASAAGTSMTVCAADAMDGSLLQDNAPLTIEDDSLWELDNDALFENYVDRLFETEDASAPHKVSRKNTLNATQREIYSAVRPSIESIAAGETASAIIAASITEEQHDELLALYGQDDDRASYKAYIHRILQALYADMPYEFYWFGNTVSYDLYADRIRFRFRVAKDYSATGKTNTYDLDIGKTSAATTAATNAQRIAQAAADQDLDLYDALRYFRDEICALVSYDDDAMFYGVNGIGKNPWAIIYVFDGDPETEVVCEGYARAFKYLCDQWGIKSHNADCYTVTGTITYTSQVSGLHMWNIVQTGYGNYLVDLTNYDGTDGDDANWFYLHAPVSIETGTYGGETRTIGYTFYDAVYSYYETDTNGNVIADSLDNYKESEIGISENGYETDRSGGAKEKDTGNIEDGYTGWKTIDGKDYWYEYGILQGYDPEDPSYRGKEIYDPNADAWYWLDNVQGGAKAVSKDVYMPYTIRGEDTVGKWVRYDADGHLVKGWQETDAGTYYFDETTGAMAKGKVSIDGLPCWFDENTGIGKSLVWEQVDGEDYYWYEDGKRQGYDPKDQSYRGKEIYDPAQNAWFWLDNNGQGRKAVSKDVYQPYTYQGKDAIGKWVRYDADGRMIKGWQSTSAGRYYFDLTTGAMAKGVTTIDGKTYTFHQQTGILQ